VAQWHAAHRCSAAQKHTQEEIVMASTRYPALQGYANITRLIAALGAGIVAILGIVGALASMKEAPLAAIVGAVVALTIAWLIYVAVGASGDLAQLLIDVENHARKVAETEPRVTTVGKAEPPAG
jgi:hypothetical protein